MHVQPSVQYSNPSLPAHHNPDADADVTTDAAAAAYVGSRAPNYRHDRRYVFKIATSRIPLYNANIYSILKVKVKLSLCF
jgi:hypothetical protein